MYSGLTPLGTYDLKEALQSNRLPVEYDAIIVWADASMTNFPLNLDVFGCPKVLCVGDTHHFDSPLNKMLSYAITASTTTSYPVITGIICIGSQKQASPM